MVKVAAATALAFSLSAFACEPCPTDNDVPRAVKSATLMAIVKSDGSSQGDASKAQGPETSFFEVKKVLKGKHADKTLRARSWYGMCSYGLVLAKGTFLVLLDAPKGGVYAPVNNGCSPHVFPMTADGLAEVGGKKVKPESLLR